MKKIIKHLRRVEAEAYPEAYQLMAYYDVTSWKSLAVYCEGRPRVEAWENGYAIWTGDEIVDIASTSPVTLKQLRVVLQKMTETFKDKAVSADCREGTSYKLVQFAARRGLVIILKDEAYGWAGETFHEMELRFAP